MSKLSNEYIRGLVEGSGTFTFSSIVDIKLPAFAIKMHARDMNLLEMVRDSIGLRNKVYQYNHQGNDGYKRGPQAMLIVRDLPQIKNLIVPLFYRKLAGYKGVQFHEWILKIAEDQSVPERYKLISKIYFAGFYDRNLIRD